MTSSETAPVNNDEVTKIVEAVRAEVQKAKAEDAKRGANVRKAQEKQAAKYLKEMKDALDAARKYSRSKDKKNQEENGKKARKVLIQATTAAKEGLVITPDKPKSQKILVELANQGITTDTAAAIQDSLGKYLLGEKDIVFSTGNQKSNFEKDFSDLKKSNEVAASKFADAVEKNAGDYGLDNNQIKAKLEIAPPIVQQEPETRVLSGQEELGSWVQDMELYRSRFSETEIAFLKKLYSPKEFAEYIRTKLEGSEADHHREEHIRRIKEDCERRHVSPPDDIRKEADAILRQEVSEQVSSELFDILDSLYIQFQKERAERTFEEVTQDDFIKGIKTTSLAIVRALDSTAKYISNQEAQGDRTFTNLRLFQHTEEKYTTEDREVIKEDGKVIIKKPFFRLVPLAIPQEISLSGYINHLRSNFVHGQHRLEYLHNAKYIFNHPPGEHGFYEQLAHYAEKLSGTDIDEIMLLPDAPLVLEAFSLYDKMLDEQFAVQDWKHRPNQFTNKLEYVNTQLEEEIVERMKLFYGGKYDKTKLRNIVNIAVGMARGIFLTEPEKSASADATTPEGGGMYASYGTNDAGALTVFNPLHVAMRWQGEHMLPAYYFMTLEDGTQSRAWSHQNMWNNMQTYMDSYIKGSKDLADKKIFIDELINVTGVGGPLQRKGWRMEYALRDYLEYKDNNFAKGELDVLKSFKSMENIGYEAIVYFNSKLSETFIKASFEDSKEKQDFFRYLYKNYLIDKQVGFSEENFKNYIKDLRRNQKKNVVEKLKIFDVKSQSINEMTEAGILKAMMERTMAHEIAKRFPTKFLRMDRDRYHKDGVSRWNVVYNEMLGKKIDNREQFDEAVKDLVFAETLLRREISSKMRSRLQLQKKAKLWEIGEIEDNRLDEDKIEKLLSGVDQKGAIPQDRIKRAIEVYKKIKATYLKPEFLNSIYEKEVSKFKFTFGIEDTDFSFMAFRGTGPRIIPRVVGDTSGMEKNIIGGILDMPKMLNVVATNGKHDFGPILEYMQKAKNQFLNVHGMGAAAEFNYKIAASVIAYYKKDSWAKPLFGLFGINKRNSIAAEVAGRSTAVWEWDSRDIDRFCVALESMDLLKRNPYDLSTKPKDIKHENIWVKIPIFNIPIKTPFQTRVVDYKFNTRRLRKEFGGDYKDIGFDLLNQFMPIASAFLMWKFFQDAMNEAEGKKK